MVHPLHTNPMWLLRFRLGVTGWPELGICRRPAISRPGGPTANQRARREQVRFEAAETSMHRIAATPAGDAPEIPRTFRWPGVHLKTPCISGRKVAVDHELHLNRVRLLRFRLGVTEWPKLGAGGARPDADDVGARLACLPNDRPDGFVERASRLSPSRRTPAETERTVRWARSARRQSCLRWACRRARCGSSVVGGCSDAGRQTCHGRCHHPERATG